MNAQDRVALTLGRLVIDNEAKADQIILLQQEVEKLKQQASKPDPATAE